MKRNGALKKLTGVLFIALCMVVPAGLWFHFNGFEPSPPALDCAQLARNLARGGGFTTGCLRPASLTITGGVSGHPDLYHPPLYPLLLSSFFRIGGATNRIMFLFSLSLFWLTGLVLVGLVWKTFDSRPALLTALFYFTNGRLLSEVQVGSPVLLNSCLFAFLIYVLLHQRDTNLFHFGLGVGLGIGYLASYLWLWFAVLILIYCVFFNRKKEGSEVKGKKKVLTAICIISGFVLVGMGWWWRNLVVAGNPFFSLRGYGYKMFTALFPGQSLLQEVDPTIIFRFPSLKEFARKWMEGGRLAYEHLLDLSRSYLIPFFWISFIISFPERLFSRVRYLVFLCLLISALHFIFAYQSLDSLELFIPVAIALGTVVFWKFREKIPAPRSAVRKAILAIFILLNVFPFFDNLRLTPVRPVPTRSNLLKVMKLVPEPVMVISNIPETVAWYAQRDSILLPVRVENVPAILRRYPAIQYIYLTSGILTYPNYLDRPSWPFIYQNYTASPFWRTEAVTILPDRQFLLKVAPLP